MTQYEAIIIGTGQAGPALVRRLSSAGMHVAIIERGRFGGTCVNTGCTLHGPAARDAYPSDRRRVHSDDPRRSRPLPARRRRGGRLLRREE